MKNAKCGKVLQYTVRKIQVMNKRLRKVTCGLYPTIQKDGNRQQITVSAHLNKRNVGASFNLKENSFQCQGPNLGLNHSILLISAGITLLTAPLAVAKSKTWT